MTVFTLHDCLQRKNPKMVFLKKAVSAAAITMFMAAGALVGTTGAASARMACNSEGDCWHTDTRVAVPGVRFNYHPDDYYFHQRWDGDEHRHWREHHEGRGYYRGGVWITL